MKIDLELIRREAETIRQYLGDEYDSEAFADTLDGQTDAMDAIGWLLTRIRECDAAVDQSRALARHYSDRASRQDDTRSKMRDSLQRLMEATGERKIKHPLGTVALKALPPSVILSDDFNIHLLPQFARVSVTADRKLIKDALEAGEVVPGASLSNGGQTVMVRS